MDRIHQAKDFNLVKSFKDNIEGSHLAKKLDLNIIDNIPLHPPISCTLDHK